jgi:hypothetical protein
MMSLADEIINQHIPNIRAILQYGPDVNAIDEYGFTPLIEAAIANNIEIAVLLLNAGANPNVTDSTGGTALQWAAENNNSALAELLLNHRADPNAYNFSGQPVMVMPLLRQHGDLKALLQKHGADLSFAQDFINAKLLGHMFELVGTGNIVAPNNQYVEIDFEGFFLEVSLAIISESLAQFENHFAARKLRRFSEITRIIIQALANSTQLIKLQQYQTNLVANEGKINALIKQEPLVIPVGYEGHAITFIKFHGVLAKCDRREDSRLYDNIVFYKVNDTKHFNDKLVKHLIYEKTSDQFINHDLETILNLTPITELKVEAQISGNCSWANVEACIPSIFFLMLMSSNNDVKNIPQFKSLALNFFHQWREWNKNRALHFCIQSFEAGDTIRNVCKAEILAAILFQRCNDENFSDKDRIESILSVLFKTNYIHIIENYVKTYIYEGHSQEGKHFAALLRAYGYTKI